MATTVFISHSWSHVDDLKNLRKLLTEKEYFNVEFKEVAPSNPIDSDNSNYIKRVLTQNINDSDIVIGIAGLYASHSDWIEWELNKAEKLGKPIIGVKPRGNSKISKIVANKAIEIVSWNTNSIVSAIRRNK